MKHLLILTVGICLLIAVPVMADQAADEAAIREASEKIVAAYNAHDVAACAALYDEKIESFDGSGKAEHKKIIEEGFQLYKAVKYSPSKPSDEIGITFIKPDVAIHKLRREITGVFDADGKPMPPLKQIHARVFMKRDGKWLLAAYFSAPIEE